VNSGMSQLLSADLEPDIEVELGLVAVVKKQTRCQDKLKPASVLEPGVQGESEERRLLLRW
jgi:hypothetical protein